LGSQRIARSGKKALIESQALIREGLFMSEGSGKYIGLISEIRGMNQGDKFKICGNWYKKK
jgi:hypothetical protein